MDLLLVLLVVALPAVALVLLILWAGVSHLAALIFILRLGWHRRKS